uniref:Retrotransposon gag domain-containing protein n=1 Tax=Cannabis sativa TaxID=3483 RepID=A0A803PCI1_CANSA
MVLEETSIAPGMEDEMDTEAVQEDFQDELDPSVRTERNLEPMEEDVLAWSHSDMTGIDHNTIYHALKNLRGCDASFPEEKTFRFSKGRSREGRGDETITDAQVTSVPDGSIPAPSTQEGQLKTSSIITPSILISNVPIVTSAGQVVVMTPEEMIEQMVARKLEGIEAIIHRIPGVPAPIKKSLPSSFADSQFVDAKALVEMPKKFVFPSMKMYDETTDRNDHIESYKQRMFTVAIPRELREACMCKWFGSSLVGPALQWYTNLPNNSISSFAQLTDIFVEQFASSMKFEKLSDNLYRIK